MKIRDRISKIYTIISSCAVIALCTVIYLFDRQFVKHDFKNILAHQLTTYTNGILPVDSLPKWKASFYSNDSVLFFYSLHVAPDTRSLMNELKSFPSEIPDITSFTNDLLHEKEAYSNKNGHGIYGQTYTSNESINIFLVSAVDVHGINQLHFLKWLLIVGVFLTILIIFFIGRRYSGLALKPISAKITKAQNISANNLSARLIVYNKDDELGQLAIVFNQMLERLEKAFESQKVFISSASHEIKNPLASIIGEAEVCLEKPRTEEEYKKIVANILSSSIRLNNLINTLLNLSKVENFDNAILQENIRVDELIIGVKKELNKIIPENNITLDFSSAPNDQNELIIKGNSMLLKSVLINVCENACKYSDNKKVVLKLQVQNKDVLISIEDMGIGIPEADKANIFQPLFRASNSLKKPGVGLGLSLAKKIIDLHKGSITFHSTPDQGTVFIIRLSSILP